MSFNELFATFANNLMPILLLGSAGFLLGKFLTVDSRTLGRVVFYLFSPLLVFDLLLNSQLDFQQALTTIGFAVAVALVAGLLALSLGKAIHLDRPLLLAVILTASFGNTGNYGLPLVSFAFGKEALAYATIYFVTNSLLFNTIGVLIASLGHMDLRTALFGLFRVPTVYAVILAILLKGTGFVIPLPLTRTIDLAAGGSIPAMLVLLGLELNHVQWSHNIGALSLGTFMRLVASPLIGILLAMTLGLQGAARDANIAQSSMPTAVTITVLASEYHLEPALVTAIVFVSTILSPFTLTPLLVYLGN